MDMQNNQSNSLTLAQIITVISLALGLLFDYFFYDKLPGISFPVYVVLKPVKGPSPDRFLN